MSEVSLNSYSIVKKVGQGSMSEVFLAETVSGQKVAIKILRSFLKDQDKYKNRLELEARTLAQMDDERIVRPLGTYITEDGRLALVQEFVDGKNLEELLLQAGEDFQNPILGAIIISEILLGVEEAHRQGIIHRDLKPENIMITSQGKIKITDFGVAKNLESEELTTTGMILGSPAYMSPEQALGQRVDEGSDLFSLGILLYRFATGKLPFKGESYAGLIQNIINMPPLNADKLNPKIHPEFKKILQKSLEKNTKDRYRKAYEFRVDLMRFLDHLGAPSAKKILVHFFENRPEQLKFCAEESLVGTLIGRAKAHWQEGRTEQGILLVKQAIEVDPKNEMAKQLLREKLHKKKNHRPWALVLIFIFFLGLSWSLYLNREEAPIITAQATPTPGRQPPTVMTPTPEKKEEVDKVESRVSAIQKPRLAPEPVARKQIKEENFAPRGKVQFNVNDDVWVYLDGKRIPNLSAAQEITAGIHEIELLRPGFSPIKSTILIKAGETTVINSRDPDH